MHNQSDWRSPAAQQQFAEFDYADCAQEFVRRSPDYRRDYEQVEARIAVGGLNERNEWEVLARRWGMIFPCAPDVTAKDAPALWEPAASPTTVILDSTPQDFADARPVNIHALGEIVADHEARDGRHMVVASADAIHRLWLRELQPDTPLAVVIPTDFHFATRIAAVARFERRLSGVPCGHRPPEYRPTAFQRSRLFLLLNLLDAETEGASRREMAFTIIYRNSAPMGRAEWKGSSQRRRTHRMIDEAKHMMACGYRQLLLGG